MHRRPEFTEPKPDPSLIKPTAGPSIENNDNQNHNHHHASTTNDQPAKSVSVIQQPPGPSAAANRSIQPNATTTTAWKGKNAPQQNSSRTTSNAGNVATNVYRPPPPKNQPTNAPPTAPKQQPQQPAAKPDTTEPATTSMDVDYMAGEDDMAFFESEDEKWMMGDFDIDLDVDLGRPIDFEADESATNQDDSGFMDANSSGNPDARKGTPSVPGPVASASAQRNAAASNRNNNVNGPGLGSSTNGNNNLAQRSGASKPVDSTSTSVNPKGNGNNGGGNKAVSFQPLSNVRPGGNGTSNGNGNNRGQPPNGPNGNGNGNGGGGARTSLPNPTSTVQPSGSGNGRPSAGGFSFPPGAVRRVLDLYVRDRNDNQNQSGIGSKRPAESMLQHPQQQ